MIRVAKLDDLEKIVALEMDTLGQSLGLDFLTEELNNNMFATLLVYQIDNTVAGYLGYRLVDNHCEILNVCVSKEYQQQGIASKMFGYLFEILSKIPKATIILEVRASNNRARALYKKLGFNQILVRPNYYQDEDGYVLLKEF